MSREGVDLSAKMLEVAKDKAAREYRVDACCVFVCFCSDFGIGMWDFDMM